MGLLRQVAAAFLTAVLFCGIGVFFVGFATVVSAAELAESLAPCLACHGETGTSTTQEIPSLGGQPADYLLVQLFILRNGQRVAAPMNDLVKNFSDEDLQNFAAAFAKLPAPAAAPAPDSARMERAAALIAKHKCGFCHNPDFTGHDQIPRLARQREDYLVKAMRGYKSGTRSGYDPAMSEVLGPVSDAEILDLAYGLAHQ